MNSPDARPTPAPTMPGPMIFNQPDGGSGRSATLGGPRWVVRSRNPVSSGSISRVGSVEVSLDIAHASLGAAGADTVNASPGVWPPPQGRGGSAAVAHPGQRLLGHPVPA